MRRFISHIITLSLFCSVVSSYAFGDPQQELARERRRIVPPSQPVQQAPLPAYARERQAQQLRERGIVQNGSSAGSMLNQPQVVSIDRLKVQSDTPAEYQIEALQTLNIQDSDPSRAVEEVKAEPAEIAKEELKVETSVEEVAAAVEEALPEEPEEVSPVDVKVIQAGTGHTIFRIIEDEHRIVVTQVEGTSKTGKPVP
jgi:hypothetical protein